MKKQADKHRTERQFQAGDWVFLKLQPYVQTSLAPRSNNELCFKYFGPYQIIAKVGQVVYKLKLPDHCQLHPVFHVSLLKKAPSAPLETSDAPPPSDNSYQVPLAILDRRFRRRNDKMVSQILIHWSSLPVSLATWEDEEALRQDFPTTPTWGQAVSQGGRDVTRPLSSSPKENKKHQSLKNQNEEAPELAGRAGMILRERCAKKPNAKYYGPEWK